MLPRVNTRIVLAYMESVAKVVTNQEILPKPIRNPLISPSTTPVDSVIRIVSKGLHPAFIAKPKATAAAPVVDATERSSIPHKITNVIPIARMKTTDCARKILRMLPHVGILRCPRALFIKAGFWNATMALIPFVYRPGESALHLLDVRLKIFLICLVSVSMLSANFIPCLVYSLLLLFFLKHAQIKIFQLLISMKFFLLLRGFVFVTRCFSTPGDELISAYGLTISRQGVMTGFLVAFKFLLVMMTGILFSGTTRPSEVKSAVQWFLRPIPFLPEKRMAVMISLSLAFMPIILKQNQKVSDAQAARCGNLEKNPIKKPGP